METTEEPAPERSIRYPCVGGPMDGQDGSSRFPKGFILVDKPNDKCWIYDLVDDDWETRFAVREEEGRPLDTDGRIRAAMENDYDVRTMP